MINNNNTMYSRYDSQVKNSNCKVLDREVKLYSTPNNSIENSYHIMIPPGIFYDKYMENSYHYPILNYNFLTLDKNIVTFIQILFY